MLISHHICFPPNHIASSLSASVDHIPSDRYSIALYFKDREFSGQFILSWRFFLNLFSTFLLISHFLTRFSCSAYFFVMQSLDIKIESEGNRARNYRAMFRTYAVPEIVRKIIKINGMYIKWITKFGKLYRSKYYFYMKIIYTITITNFLILCGMFLIFYNSWTNQK